MFARIRNAFAPAVVAPIRLVVPINASRPKCFAVVTLAGLDGLYCSCRSVPLSSLDGLPTWLADSIRTMFAEGMTKFRLSNLEDRSQSYTIEIV